MAGRTYVADLSVSLLNIDRGGTPGTERSEVTGVVGKA